jgi:hypothetical protein
MGYGGIPVVAGSRRCFRRFPSVPGTDEMMTRRSTISNVSRHCFPWKGFRHRSLLLEADYYFDDFLSSCTSFSSSSFVLLFARPRPLPHAIIMALFCGWLC